MCAGDSRGWGQKVVCTVSVQKGEQLLKTASPSVSAVTCTYAEKNFRNSLSAAHLVSLT